MYLFLKKNWVFFSKNVLWLLHQSWRQEFKYFGEDGLYKMEYKLVTSKGVSGKRVHGHMYGGYKQIECCYSEDSLSYREYSHLEDEISLIFDCSIGALARPLFLEPFLTSLSRTHSIKLTSICPLWLLLPNPWDHFGIEVSHNNAVVGLRGEVEGPRYVIKHILHSIIRVSRGRS